MLVTLNAVSAGSEHTIGWVSLQVDGSISVGLAYRAFISPRFHARQFLWNAYNRVTVQYLAPQGLEELRPVTNPHLTCHPPIYFHLRANNGQELFAGIGEVEIMLAQDARVPWVRFASRPVREMSPAGVSRDPNRTTVLRIPVESPAVSVGLAVDFVRPGSSDPSGGLMDHFVDCGQNRLHVFCEALAEQQPTLAWYHQY
jgi:hypothetical protein